MAVQWGVDVFAEALKITRTQQARQEVAARLRKPIGEIQRCRRCNRWRWIGAACECVTPEEWERYLALTTGKP